MKILAFVIVAFAKVIKALPPILFRSEFSFKAVFSKCFFGYSYGSIFVNKTG